MENFYSGHQIKSLTGLRGVGAMMVVIYHMHLHDIPALYPLLNYGGSAGVMIFFSLSGYILAHIYSANFQSTSFYKDYYDFIGKRIARIYPLHIFLLFLTLLYYPKLNITGYSGPKQLFTNLTLTHGWTFDDLSFIAASWSISIEFLFYLIFPAMILFANRLLAFTAFLFWSIFFAMVSMKMVPISPELAPYFGHKIFIYGTFFVLGVCVFYMSQHELVKKLLDNNFTFIAFSLVLIILPFTSRLLVIGTSAFIIPLWIRSVHTSTIGNYLLGGTLMLVLGELSYSIYMSHQMIYLLVSDIDQKQPVSPAIAWMGYYILLFIWCAFCYYMIEIPMRSKLRNMFHRKGKV